MLKWLSMKCVPESCKYTNKWKSSMIKACCICHRKRNVIRDSKECWAVLDVNNNFTFYVLDKDELTPLQCSVYYKHPEITKQFKTAIPNGLYLDKIIYEETVK